MNARMHMMTTAISAAISSNAQPGRCRPKNNHDHATIKPSWSNHQVRAPIRRDDPVSQIFQAASAISRYSIAHTGPNAFGGGVHEGLYSAWYQAPASKLLPMAAVLTAMRSARPPC